MTIDTLIGKADMGSCVSFGLAHLELVCVMPKLVDQWEMQYKKEDIPISKTAECSTSNLRTTQAESSAFCLELGAGWKLRWIFCTLPLSWVINKKQSILSLLLLVLGKSSLANFWVFFETDGSVASPINYLASEGAGDFKRRLSISCWCSLLIPMAAHFL